MLYYQNLPFTSSNYYRSFVGPPELYDVVGAQQFNLLTNYLGLREHHTLLDIGCGSLRLGRLLIVYLMPERYYGVEPRKGMVRQGLRANLGEDLVKRKMPHFKYNADYDLRFKGRTFDYAIAQSVFTHAPLSQIRKCIESVGDVLNPNGIFAFNFIRGNTDHTGNEWTYPNTVVYKPSTISSEVEKLKLVCKHINFPLATKSKWTIMSKTTEAVDEIEIRVRELRNLHFSTPERRDLVPYY